MVDFSIADDLYPRHTEGVNRILGNRNGKKKARTTLCYVDNSDVQYNDMYHQLFLYHISPLVIFTI